MAKTDSFFIRSTKDLGNTNTYHEKSIDLGAFVDALGKSVLRIHNIEVVYSDNTGRSNQIQATDVGVAQFQLMTQTQTDIVLASNKSVIATGKLHAFNQLAAGSLATEVSTDIDFGPQHWTNGYLVGVEQIYFGGSAGTGFVGDLYCTVILECTVEKLDKEAAMALALSQQ
ncbi:unnamed protein product [marine sediment metagenome]|uniref:Uncharacterized protein n=1 Tax=marine sediment metagenome TaxID=412755 RepID=X1QX79_9ZZZZ